MENSDNELIAEFMGVKETKGLFDTYGHQESCYYTTNDLYRSPTFTVPDLSLTDFFNNAKYDTSWDWLMPVVENIETRGYFFIIRPGSIETYQRVPAIHLNTTGGKSKKGMIYEAVVEFIKWYNSKTKQQ